MVVGRTRARRGKGVVGSCGRWTSARIRWWRTLSEMNLGSNGLSVRNDNSDAKGEKAIVPSVQFPTRSRRAAGLDSLEIPERKQRRLELRNFPGYGLHPDSQVETGSRCGLSFVRCSLCVRSCVRL